MATYPKKRITVPEYADEGYGSAYDASEGYDPSGYDGSYEQPYHGDDDPYAPKVLDDGPAVQYLGEEPPEHYDPMRITRQRSLTSRT
jgi:hypothetical protein